MENVPQKITLRDKLTLSSQILAQTLNNVRLAQPITSSVRWQTGVGGFQIQGVCLQALISSLAHLILLSPHFSHRQNTENPVLCSQKRLLCRLKVDWQMHFLLPSNCLAGLPSLWLLPSTILLSELCTTIWLLCAGGVAKHLIYGSENTFVDVLNFRVHISLKGAVI